MILKYKWALVRRFSIVNATILLFFAILTIIYLQLGFRNSGYIYAFIGFGIYFLVNESISVYINSIGYFADIWNVIDISRIILIFVYSIIKLRKL